MVTAELFAGPGDGATLTLPGRVLPEIRVPAIDPPSTDVSDFTICAHIYAWHGSRGQTAIYRYIRTERCR